MSLMDPWSAFFDRYHPRALRVARRGARALHMAEADAEEAAGFAVYAVGRAYPVLLEEPNDPLTFAILGITVRRLLLRALERQIRQAGEHVHPEDLHRGGFAGGPPPSDPLDTFIAREDFDRLLRVLVHLILMRPTSSQVYFASHFLLVPVPGGAPRRLGFNEVCEFTRLGSHEVRRHLELHMRAIHALMAPGRALSSVVEGLGTQVLQRLLALRPKVTRTWLLAQKGLPLEEVARQTAPHLTPPQAIALVERRLRLTTRWLHRER